MVEISLSTDLLSSETEITSIIVFVAMTDSKWESIPLQHRINNEWEATVKVVLKRSIPRRYYYFYSVNSARCPYDPELPSGPMFTTGERFNYIECNFDIISFTSVRDIIVEGRPLPPWQIISPRPIASFHLARLLAAVN